MATVLVAFFAAALLWNPSVVEGDSVFTTMKVMMVVMTTITFVREVIVIIWTFRYREKQLRQPDSLIIADYCLDYDAWKDRVTERSFQDQKRAKFLAESEEIAEKIASA